MKIKNEIRTVLGCMVLAGMLSFNIIPVQAASCSHKICETFYDVKAYYYEKDGHYGDFGTSYICADCGYQYWGDDVEYQRIGDHDWELSKMIWAADGTTHYLFECADPDCHWDFYD